MKHFYSDCVHTQSCGIQRLSSVHVPTFMVMSLFSETCSTQRLANLSDFSWTFRVVFACNLLPFFIHWLFYPHLKISKGLCLQIVTRRFLIFTGYVVRNKYSWYTGRHLQITGNASGSKKVFQPLTAASFQPTRTKNKKRDTDVGLGSTEGSKKTFGCEILNLIILDNTSCHRNQSKSRLIIRAFAFLKPLRISAHLCAFLIWTHQITWQKKTQQSRHHCRPNLSSHKVRSSN